MDVATEFGHKKRGRLVVRVQSMLMPFILRAGAGSGHINNRQKV